MESSSSSRFWLLAGGTLAAGLGGYWTYSYYSNSKSSAAQNKDDLPSSMLSAEARLRIARSIQMQTLAGGGMPTSPAPRAAQPPAVRQTPKQPAKAGGSGGNRKICALCSQPTPPGLPLRCSGCKQVYYCSQDCQRKAWPDHKGSCKSMSAAASKSNAAPSTSSTAASTSSASTNAPAAPSAKQQEAPASLPGLAVAAAEGAAAEGKEEPKTFQDALAMYLEQNAASKSDKMEATFEVAVMQFVKGEFPTAITQLQAVQAMAKERGATSVEGDVFKWLGHAHNKMGDFKRAEELFREGVKFANKTNEPRLEIECLGGLGCMMKARNETGEAVKLLTRALHLSDVLDDADSKASTLCNLGSALMQSSTPADSDKAMVHLREAVQIREHTVQKLHAMGERSGLATAVMEHAHAMINLANALYIRKEFGEAKSAYEQALEVFELVEDADKVSKVLINLSNMCEMQIKTVASRQEAAGFRARLAAFLEEKGLKGPDPTCPVCLGPQKFKDATTSDDKEIVVLSCAHSAHNKCWENWVSQKTQTGSEIVCPQCSQAVPVFMVN